MLILVLAVSKVLTNLIWIESLAFEAIRGVLQKIIQT